MSVDNGPVRKLTISLPSDLLEFADREAACQNISRSRFIARVLSRIRDEEEERLAVEGYHFYADEASEFAAISIDAVAETLGRES